MKRTIKLSESKLRQMIAESVKRVLDEVSFDTAQRAYMATQDVNRPMSQAMQRRMQKNPFARAQQSNNLKKGANNSFNREYGYNLKNIPYGSDDDTNMDVADTSKSFYGGGNLYGPHSDYFQEVGGKYQGEGEPSRMYARSTEQRNFGGSNVNDGENQEMSFKNKMTNPQFYNAVRKGRNAINRTHGIR